MWKLSDERDWLWENLGLALMCKSLIRFSVDGRGCAPSLLFDQTMVELMKIMVTSFKRCHAFTAALSAPQTCSRPLPTPLLGTPGYSRASLGQSLWGHCSFLLGPGAHKVLFVPAKSLFPSPVEVLSALWWG